MKYYEHLAVFYTVYKENGHITSAANILNLTKPTISRQIKSLEAKIDKKLFIKSGRLLKPTNHADKLASLISSSVITLNNVINKKTDVSNVVIAIDFTVVDIFDRKKLCENVISRYEDLSFDIISLHNYDAINNLSSSFKNIDFIITDLEITNSIYDKLKLFKRHYFIAGNDYYLKKIRSLAKETNIEFSLNSVPWVMYSLEWVAYCKKTIKREYDIELKMDDVKIISDEEITRQLLISGKGIGLVSSWMISEDIKHICKNTIKLEKNFYMYCNNNSNNDNPLFIKELKNNLIDSKK